MVCRLTGGRAIFTVSRVNRLAPLIPFLSALPFGLVLLGAFSSPAHASLTVCNKTVHAASVAVGYFNGAAWSSAGWWVVGAGQCAQMVKERLAARYYYLYATHHDIGGAWDGDRSFCVAPARFQIAGRDNCLSQGYQVRRFFQVDTGNMADWTENLAD